MSKQPSAPPPGDKPTPTAPPPPPAWRHWLWPIALIATLGLYFFLPSINTSKTVTLPYSTFLSDVSANKIKSANFGSGSNGSNRTVTGTLRNGRDFTTVAPPDTTAVQAQLTKNRASVTNSTPSTGLGTEILYWVILLAPLIFVFWLFRRMSRGGAGALQGALGVGRSRAKVFDAERPSTKFTDVAGYE